MLIEFRRSTFHVVKRSDGGQGFVVMPRRRVVKRTLAWLNRNRPAKDCDARIGSAETWLFIANVKLPHPRLARCAGDSSRTPRGGRDA